MKVIAKIAPKQGRGKDLTIVYGWHASPFGPMLVALTADGLCWLGFAGADKRLAADFPRANIIEDKAATAKAAAAILRGWKQVKKGGLEAIGLPVVLYGTAFQMKVWKELTKIKPGQVTTYAALARKIGSPAASRAVGSAVGKNPVSVVVPCHRVVNKDHGIVNYGWGPALKKKLLAGEGAPV